MIEAALSERVELPSGALVRAVGRHKTHNLHRDLSI
jgi:hypothetical protein